MAANPSQLGLTSAQVNERVTRGESNNFKARVGRGYLEIVRDNLFNLFNIVLGLLLIVVVIMGDAATALFAGFQRRHQLHPGHGSGDRRKT